VATDPNRELAQTVKQCTYLDHRDQARWVAPAVSLTKHLDLERDLESSLSAARADACLETRAFQAAQRRRRDVR
jgi:hypothetical protein